MTCRLRDQRDVTDIIVFLPNTNIQNISLERKMFLRKECANLVNFFFQLISVEYHSVRWPSASETDIIMLDDLGTQGGRDDSDIIVLIPDTDRIFL